MSNGLSHRQVTIEFRSTLTEVDEAIAPFLLRWWVEGFPTVYSCQGGEDHFPIPGYQSFSDGYVCFAPSVEDPWAALALVGWDRPGLLYMEGTKQEHIGWTVRFPSVATMPRELPVLR